MKLSGNLGNSLWESLPVGGNHTCEKWQGKNWKEDAFELECAILHIIYKRNYAMKKALIFQKLEKTYCIWMSGW
jgi:hypothetical protein